MLKIAYIITAYTDPSHLFKLIEALGNQDIYIHIDKKVDLNCFKQALEYKNVKLIENRINIEWGGYSQVESLTELLNEVSKNEYDRVVCLSGTDYPSYKIDVIENEFENNKDKEYINAINITNNINYNNKITQYWNFDIKNKYFRILTNQFIFKLLKIIGYKKKDYLDINNKKWNIYFGSDYFSLTYECAMYVLNNLKNNETLIKYFRTSYVPSEMAIQTIVFNSKYAKNADLINEKWIRYEKLCSLHYEIYEPLVKVMTINDFDDIRNSKKLFFRKAKTGFSDELIEHIINN